MQFKDKKLEEAILKYATQYGFDPDLIRSVISVESGGRADLVSDAGAIGVMQTVGNKPVQDAIRLGKLTGTPDRSTIDGQVQAGTAYLAALRDGYGIKDRTLLLRAYNGGPKLRTTSPNATAEELTAKFSNPERNEFFNGKQNAEYSQKIEAVYSGTKTGAGLTGTSSGVGGGSAAANVASTSQASSNFAAEAAEKAKTLASAAPEMPDVAGAMQGGLDALNQYQANIQQLYTTNVQQLKQIDDARIQATTSIYDRHNFNPNEDTSQWNTAIAENARRDLRIQNTLAAAEKMGEAPVGSRDWFSNMIFGNQYAAGAEELLGYSKIQSQSTGIVTKDLAEQQRVALGMLPDPANARAALEAGSTIASAQLEAATKAASMPLEMYDAQTKMLNSQLNMLSTVGGLYNQAATNAANAATVGAEVTIKNNQAEASTLQLTQAQREEKFADAKDRLQALTYDLQTVQTENEYKKAQALQAALTDPLILGSLPAAAQNELYTAFEKSVNALDEQRALRANGTPAEVATAQASEANLSGAKTGAELARLQDAHKALLAFNANAKPTDIGSSSMTPEVQGVWANYGRTGTLSNNTFEAAMAVTSTPAVAPGVSDSANALFSTAQTIMSKASGGAVDAEGRPAPPDVKALLVDGSSVQKSVIDAGAGSTLKKAMSSSKGMRSADNIYSPLDSSQVKKYADSSGMASAYLNEQAAVFDNIEATPDQIVEDISKWVDGKGATSLGDKAQVVAEVFSATVRANNAERKYTAFSLPPQSGMWVAKNYDAGPVAKALLPQGYFAVNAVERTQNALMRTKYDMTSAADVAEYLARVQ